MRPLEIVLTAVVGAIIIIAVVAIIIYKYYKWFVVDKVIDHRIHNDFAHKHKTVFLGDSLTDFFPVLEYFHDGEMHNRGIASEKTTDVLNRIEDVIILEPKKLVLQIGINDLIYSKKCKPQELVSRIMQIAERFKGIGSEVHIISLYPVNRKATKLSPFICRHANNKRVCEVNEQLKKACAESNIDYIDLHSLLKDENGNLNVDYTVEGLHLSANGYRIVTAALLPCLETEG